MNDCRTRERKAEGPGNVKVEICAIQGGQYAGGPETPINGVPVARMRNLGNQETELWDLTPGPYESYIIVYGDPTTNSVKYDILEVSTATPPAGPPAVKLRGGVYNRCGHIKPTPARGNASFGGCNDGAGGPNDPTDPAPMAFRQTFGVNGPAWIDCGGDCCTTNPI